MPWQNWARIQQCTPVRVEHPHGTDAIADAVKRAAAEGRRVKAVGSGHSFTDIAVTPPDGVQLVLDQHTSVVSVDHDARRVTVEAGITIAELSRTLARLGLALPNLGDIAYQTISGAVSTGTHGTGVRLRGIAAQIVGVELVTGDGSVVTHGDADGDILACARVGLGTLGVLSTVTLQCVPAFHLRAVEHAMPVDAVLEQLDELVDGNDHFEFFYIPHTTWAFTKRNNRTEDPVGGQSRWTFVRDKVLLENVALGALWRIGRRRPEWIPRLNTALPSSGRVEYVKPSHEVFATPRWVKFVEMEYSVPRAAGAEVVREVRSLIDRSGLRISVPVEVRFTAGDDIPLSTAYGGERCYVAVHVYTGTPWEQYFRGVESIMRAVGGRPHWGKLHYRTADDLAPAYPEWDRFQGVRARLDPEGVFANPYLDRVLGAVPST